MEPEQELISANEAQPQQLPLPSGPRPDHDTLLAALQGLLFVHNHPIPTQRISEILELPFSETEHLLLEFKQHMDETPSSGLQMIVTEQGVQLATKACISQFIQRLEGQKLVSLSLPALETLAVIAFKQPITRAEMEAIRGVNCDGVVSTLLEKKLIYVSGEKPVLGRPRLYSTTQDFLYYFGLKSLKELALPDVDLPVELPPTESLDVTAAMNGETADLAEAPPAVDSQTEVETSAAPDEPCAAPDDPCAAPDEPPATPDETPMTSEKKSTDAAGETPDQ